jgi:hypothetical protein
MDSDGKPKVDERGKPIKMRNKQYCTELLRKFMINANLTLPGIQLWLGNDNDLVEELIGTTERKTDGGYTVYYSTKKANNWNPRAQEDHNRDAATYLAHAISYGILQESDTFSDMEMINACGWAGVTGQVDPWRPPWG